MKPKNKFQQKAVEASKKLPPLTDAQKRWAFTKVVESVGRRTSKGIITCLDCGEVFHNDTKRKHCTCPNCRTKLYIEDTRKQKFHQQAYATYITSCDGMQVVRVFMVNYFARIGRTPNRFCREVMQRWIAPDGKYCTLALLRQTMGTYYIDSWIYSSDLELRSESASNKFYVNVYDKVGDIIIYPHQRIIPELRQRGYKGDSYGILPFNLFRTILSSNKAETLLKMGYIDLFRQLYYDDFRNIDQLWPAIRICFRNHYVIKDVTLWIDYVKLLLHYKKDLHNAKYVCPANLTAEHDRYVAKRNKEYEEEARRREIERREWERRAKEQKRKDTEIIEKIRAKLVGFYFTDGHLHVRALTTREEYQAEGKAMHHCVGGYYSKAGSLILSATIDGKRLETVEVSLSKLQVIQSRGVCNGQTEYHDRIVNLVNRNMPLIRKRIAA